jgi:uncharacterized membrane protein YfcA
MEFGNLPWTELAAIALAVFAAGLAAGVVAGLFGVGGGIVLVPVLAEVWSILGVDEGLRMPLAVGTSLATILPTAIRSTMGHDRKGAVDWDVLRSWAMPTVLGAILGIVLARVIGGAGLTFVFGIGALALALVIGLMREEARIGDGPPQGPLKWVYASGNGLLSAMMGIGGGTIGATVLRLYGFSMHRAIGTSAGFGFLIAMPGALGMIVNGWGASGLPSMSLGFVNLIGVALITPATWIAAPLGVALAHYLERKTLRRVFALFLASMALRMLWRLV